LLTKVKYKMLCPDCKCPAPGGSLCPSCGRQVPERESFGGQGRHYLGVLFLFSLVLVLFFILITSVGHGLGATLSKLARTGWFWLFLALFLLPNLVGLYYWSMLREEEITVTDEYIARRSHWGDEFLLWADVQAFRRKPVLFRQTRLGRIAWLSRVLTKGKLIADLLPVSYELVSRPDANGVSSVMCLEPGTIDDLPWLLQLIEERLGPPSEG